MNREILLLDGGMGQELIRRSPDAITALWGATVMRDHPDLVTGLHADFIKAGARIITLNAYNLTRPRFTMNSVDPDEIAPLIGCAGDLARGAAGADAAVAGSLPPLVGSYSPETTPELADAAAQYAEIIALQSDYADFFIAETMSSIKEAMGAVEGAKTTDKPFWVAFTTDDDDGTLLRSGETLADGVAAIKEAGGVQAVLVNCTRPEAVDQAMPVLAGCGLPYGAYANGFTRIATDYVPGSTVEKLSTRKDLGPDAYADFALAWVEGGASIIGGCCEVGPDHIARLAERLRQGGYTLVRKLSA